MVVLAAPIAALPQLLPDLAGCPGVVTDMASTKTRVLRWAAAAGVDLVGGHSMCGSERSGIEAADPDLFLDAPWVLIRDEPRVGDLMRAVGATPLVMDPELHDRLVAGVSHSAFLLSAAYVRSLAEEPEWELMRLVGPGFRDMSRLAAGDPEFYAAVVATNREAILRSLSAVEASLAKLRRHVEAGDGCLVELLEEAKRVRQRWASERAAPQRTDAAPASSSSIPWS